MPCAEIDDVLLATRDGKAIRFGVDSLRVFRGRDSTGVRGIRLLGHDRVVSMSVISNDANQFILSVTENGYGKRTPADDYRRSGRGGQGVANIETSQRNGKVIASFAVVDDDQLMLVTNMGQVIRIRVHGGDGDSIRIASRKTQGVRLFDVADVDSEKVMSAGLVRETDDEDAANTDAGDAGAEDTGAEDTGAEIAETVAVDPSADTPPVTQEAAQETEQGAGQDESDDSENEGPAQ
jgi:Type IIA topoisomerase (DNA gyrase/topo II, topoisomerase IV), A subunit